MSELNIPFEIHITTRDLKVTDEQEFVNFCVSKDAKPLMIELLKGDCIKQPMFSKIVLSKSLTDVLAVSEQIAKDMTAQNFSAKRLKIEIPATEDDLFKNTKTNFKKYYEWHCKINYIRKDKLLVICEKHKVHLSLNSLRNESDIRFITLREFGEKSEFVKRVKELKQELETKNWVILKEQSEYCIYDNNILLDSGWLS